MRYLILVSIIWGFSFGLFKGNLATMNPHLMAFIRLLVALPIFLPFLKRDTLSGKTQIQFVCVGALQYGLMYTCLNSAYRYLAGWEVAFFTIFTPIYISILVDLQTRRINRLVWFSSVMAMAGAGMIVYRESSSEELMRGVLWVQAANLCFAYGQIRYKALREQHEKLTDRSIYALLYAGAVVITVITTTINGAWGELASISGEQFLVLIYLGAIASGLCFFWWNKGAVNTSHSNLSAMNNLKIPIAIVISMVFFKEAVPLLKVGIGTGIILAGLWLPHYWRRVRKQEAT